MNRNPQSDVIWDKIRCADCVQCNLHKEAQTVCLLGDGPVPCDGMVIGEAPGYREDKIEIPFSGKSGIFLRIMLKEIGLHPRTVYITNAVACRPPGNRNPTRKEINICSSLYLVPQIDIVKPKAILLLGNSAVSFVLGKKSAVTKLAVTKLEGKILRYKGIPCVPSRHPSSVIRREDESDFPYLVQKFKENLILFKNQINPKEDTFKFEKTFPRMEEGPVYIDIETNGLNPFREEAVIHSAALVQDEEVSCFRIHNGMTLKRMLESHPIISHRATFEGTWLKQKYGITPRIYYDTKLGAFLRNENEETGLKYQAMKHLKVDPWVEDMDFQDPDFDVLLPYNARDSKYGMRLYKEVDLPFLKANLKIAKLMKYILLPAEEVFIDVICNGFHIDERIARQRLKQCQVEKKKLNAELNKIAGIEINPGSPKQISTLFYKQLRLKCPVKTAKGAPSTAEAALIRLKGQHPAVDIMTNWRQWEKYDSTYLTPWLERGPVLHANYGLTDTDTGRLNSTMVKDKRGEKGAGATLHQIPRDEFIRTIVTPRHRDWCIIEGDTSQGELRFTAHAADDPTMIKIFHKDSSTPEGDIHYQTARTLQPTGEIIKETRKKAKAVNFGFVFGMFAKKFVDYALEKFDVTLTLKEGEEYRRKFFRKYSGLGPWHRRVEAFVTANGFIDSIFGRRRHLPMALHTITKPCNCGGEDENCFDCGGDGYVVIGGGAEEWMRREAIRQAINSPIQSANSDLTLWIAALIASKSLPWKFKLDRARAFCFGSAHDSLLFECHYKYARELIDGITWTVSNLPWHLFNIEMRVPVKMDLTAYEHCWKGKVLAV